MITHARFVGTPAKPLRTAHMLPACTGVIIAAASLIIGLCAFATGHVAAGATAVIVAAVLGTASTLWLLRAHRKVRDAERRWHDANSDQPSSPPSS